MKSKIYRIKQSRCMLSRVHNWTVNVRSTVKSWVSKACLRREGSSLILPSSSLTIFCKLTGRPSRYGGRDFRKSSLSDATCWNADEL